ncbi:unnamed protein product [Spirodela intermedia]|uniref:CAF-1 p60 homolog n=1 Tax=Spirodela intermedia TaxID=51605 RepID=A0A7I8JC60_SPIIN|nr:unnamed protein product [Spirodela intermedia]CAA6667724.1 unnamed protein product [Spirodela intermedia]
MKGGTLQINWHDTKPVLTLDFHPPSGLLATGGNDHDIKLWAVMVVKESKKGPTTTYKNSLSYHSSAVNVLRFSPSGEHLASGADGGELVIWKLHSADDIPCWKVLKTLLFHRKDVMDLQWSPDGGSVHQILDGHLHYVQGVAWDPLGQFVASLSSDRTCRIYVNKPQAKVKSHEKLNYVCQHVVSKSEPQRQDDAKAQLPKAYLFHDDTLTSFFRRLAWSPDGSFLLVPAGIYKLSSKSEAVNTAYIFARKDLSRGASGPVVAVRFCPIMFHLRGSNTAGSFKLPYRIVFAVATLSSLYVYDTESSTPVAILAGLHYAAVTDIAWSPDARYLAASSRDGFCTLLEFENEELGSPISTTGEREPMVLAKSTDSSKPAKKRITPVAIV